MGNLKTAIASTYSIIIPEETMARVATYFSAVQSGQLQAGQKLKSRLKHMDLRTLRDFDFFGELLDTKVPQIFAESAVVGDGTDWNLIELGVLGDVSIAVPVTVFDDGNHRTPHSHPNPFSATLVFTPGALLENGQGHPPADWAEATDSKGKLLSEGYYQLYRRRLLPVLRFVNACAGRPRSALLTVPGVGCGQFAGPFRGQLGRQLQAVIERMLHEFGSTLPNVKAVYFDPYNECGNNRTEIHGISMMVRPLTILGNERKSQLCHPSAYAENLDAFSDCALFSIVAWDHVSWPGNDFFLDARATDDGVKAAATSSMSGITGVPGIYNQARGRFQPPSTYRNWNEVVLHHRLRLWNPSAVWNSTPSA
jgi:hypothetical protein